MSSDNNKLMRLTKAELVEQINKYKAESIESKLRIKNLNGSSIRTRGDIQRLINKHTVSIWPMVNKQKLLEDLDSIYLNAQPNFKKSGRTISYDLFSNQ